MREDKKGFTRRNLETVGRVEHVHMRMCLRLKLCLYLRLYACVDMACVLARVQESSADWQQLRRSLKGVSTCV